MNQSEQMAEKMICRIEKSHSDHPPLLVAIDGRCAAGKTTLASILADHFSCDAVHMDDFFLQPNQRTLERLAEPGGNVDYERVEAEVLQPVKLGQGIVYRRFDCSRMALGEEIAVRPGKLLIVEGAYSCHPRLRDYFDLRIFVSIDAKTQMERIISRNGIERAQIFRDRWIPMEENYIRACRVSECCQMHFAVKDAHVQADEK